MLASWWRVEIKILTNRGAEREPQRTASASMHQQHASYMVPPRWWTADVPRQERHELPCTARGPAHLSKFDTWKRLTLMNLCLHQGDRVAKCSWLNPPTSSLGANKSEKTKKIQHHTVFHAFPYTRLNYTAAISVFIHYCCGVSVSVLMWKSAMNGILWRCVSSYPQIEIKARPFFNFPQKTDATDLSSKKNIVTGSPFSQIDYDFPAESSHVAPLVQTFVSLFRIKGKPAWPSKTSNSSNTCRLSLYLSLSLSRSANSHKPVIQWLVVPATAQAAVPPREQYCRVKTKVPGGCDASYPLGPHQRVHRTGMAQHLQFTRPWCSHKRTLTLTLFWTVADLAATFVGFHGIFHSSGAWAHKYSTETVNCRVLQLDA